MWQGIRFLKRVPGFTGYDSSFIKYCSMKGTQCVETDSSFMTRGSVIYCGP
ncbi:MAG TPA: hypothetical protein PK064_12890 [Bacteroidales bacterium]|nr:hypothetical protein [Bacteroidales bacterium]